MGGIRLGTEPVHLLMAEIPRVLMSCPSFHRLREAMKLDVYVECTIKRNITKIEPLKKGVAEVVGVQTVRKSAVKSSCQT